MAPGQQNLPLRDRKRHLVATAVGLRDGHPHRIGGDVPLSIPHTDRCVVDVRLADQKWEGGVGEVRVSDRVWWGAGGVTPPGRSAPSWKSHPQFPVPSPRCGRILPLFGYASRLEDPMKARRPSPSTAPASPKSGGKARPAAAPTNADQVDRLRDRDRALAGAAVSAGPTLPDNTMELLESRTLSVRRRATYVGAKGMPPEIANLLMVGVRKEGISDAQDLKGVLENYIDEGTVDVYDIADRAGGAADTWLRFTCGDTEVGYIFHGATLKAIVGDQQINPV